MCDASQYKTTRHLSNHLWELTYSVGICKHSLMLMRSNVDMSHCDL